MNRTTWLQDHRMRKFRDVLSRWEARELSCLEAGELLGCSERQFRRLRRRFEDEGLAGLADRRLGKASARRVPADELEWMLEEYRTRHLGWNVKHFHEHLVTQHNFAWGYTWTKTQLHTAGLVERAKRRGAHRRKRERKPCEGMMLHQDASRHAWLCGQPPLDLVVTMDDATSRIYSAFLIEEEGTASSFFGLNETFAAKGLPSSLYTDRGSHYFVTVKAGEAVDKSRLTQVGRALDRLGVEHIAAYSPQARGRSERMFSTLQDRLPKELVLAGIADMQAANRYLAETYLPVHNARFSQNPAVAESAFVAVDPAVLNEILCVEVERVVGHDNTVVFGKLRLQLPESPIRRHFVKARVKLRQYPDGSLAVFHGPRPIARYAKDGRLRKPNTAIRQAA
ncbi:ISNCY family transposase [Jiella avicenniae]|uniref:ISNCY family transposase n=1 Tax=Jiella avicenniae TaxID=2907202 RepID=A0A9X1P4T8_9HYPH|nr:ISNCY family transposase [Jiella avicenniae]MCE7031022.1 ISNCY family transposase [Jiella avicenniae]